MKKIGIFYGSDGGNAHDAADRIAKLLENKVEVYDIASASKEKVLEFDSLILVTSTYGAGDLQSDWEDIIDDFDTSDFAGKTIALVGIGDQDTYGDTFCDSIFHLYEKVKEGKVLGETDLDGYDFSDSKAIVDGKFVGLVLDYDNQDDLTDDRIKNWVERIQAQL